MENDDLAAPKLSLKEYTAIHAWLRYKFGKASYCEKCGDREKGYYEYALKKGCQYYRERDNFLMLCKSCHFEYDGVDPKKLPETRDENCFRKINDAKYKKVDQFTGDGDFVKTWQSATEAGTKLGINRKCIGHAIKVKHRYKTFRWKMNHG